MICFNMSLRKGEGMKDTNKNDGSGIIGFLFGGLIVFGFAAYWIHGLATSGDRIPWVIWPFLACLTGGVLFAGYAYASGFSDDKKKK